MSKPVGMYSSIVAAGGCFPRGLGKAGLWVLVHPDSAGSLRIAVELPNKTKEKAEA